MHLVGEGNGTPLQYSCLENPTDGGAWWAAVYGVPQSRTRLKWLSSGSSAPCGISVHQPGIEPGPWQWKPGILTARPPELFPMFGILEQRLERKNGQFRPTPGSHDGNGKMKRSVSLKMVVSIVVLGFLELPWPDSYPVSSLQIILWTTNILPWNVLSDQERPGKEALMIQTLSTFSAPNSCCGY